MPDREKVITNIMSNCDNCIFRGQWCEKENKCPLFKEDPEFNAHCLKKTRNLKKERREKKMKKKPTYYSAVGDWLSGRRR